MKISFLEPTSPKVWASKTIKKDDSGSITKEPFNNIYKVSDHTYELNEIGELYDLIQKHAALGHTLLKGPLNKELRNESRAGTTDATVPTKWMCLDCDGIPNIKTHDQFVATCLPAEFQGVTYIFQHSSSAKLDESKGFHGHLFFMLRNAATPSHLKEWLKQTNVSNQMLNHGLSLSSNYVTLKFSLDISTCQNDKLLYIAPPIFVSMVDPVEKRFELINKENNSVNLNLEAVKPAITNTKIQAIIDTLRKEEGLPKKTGKYKAEVLINPERAVFNPTDTSHGFVRGNVNTGNSNAYFHPEDNPNILYNFKGESPVDLKELDPEYYNEYSSKLGLIREEKAQENGLLVFRDLQSDAYWNGFHNKETNTVEAYITSSKAKLIDFMVQHGQEAPKIIRDWDYSFQPNNATVIDYKERFINQYKKPTVLKNAEKHIIDSTASYRHCPEAIKELLTHVVGDDEQLLDWFVNWLAIIVQNKQQTKAAWILHGRTGTGKGILYEDVLKPILGHTVMKQFHNLKDQFNGWMADSILTVFDECQVDEFNKKKVMEKLKNYITESELTVRLMRTNPYQVKSFSNIILFSNNQDMVELPEEDRRFWVGARQDSSYPYTTQRHEQLKLEVFEFACYLLKYPANLQKARQPQRTESKKKLIRANKNSVDVFFEAFQNGDLVYFLEFLLTPPKPNDTNGTILHDKLKRTCIKALITPDSFLSISDLQAAYQFIQGDNTTPNKFKRMLTVRNLTPEIRQINEETLHGFPIKWQISPTNRALFEYLVPLENNAHEDNEE